MSTTYPKVKTALLSADLLKPVGTALAAFLATLIVTHHFGAEQTQLLVSAVFTFIAGYIVGPTPADHVLRTLRLSKKQLAALVVAIGVALVGWLATGSFGNDELTVVAVAFVGVIAGIWTPPDPVVPVRRVP